MIKKKITKPNYTDKSKSASTIYPTTGICVDASVVKTNLLESTGRAEIQGHCLRRRAKVFCLPSQENTTNNVAEYMAIAHGLRWCLKEGIEPIIYSDSLCAISWAKNALCKTKSFTSDRQRLAILKADQLFKETKFQLYWWDKRQWQENPADFGRK